jgi:hypothetical protein
MNALAFSIAVMQAIPALIAAGVDIAQYIERQIAALQAMQADGGRDPTAEEWDALSADINAQTAALHRAAGMQ